MTDEREAKLARVLQDNYRELRTLHPLLTARMALAAIDADPVAYGYARILSHPFGASSDEWLVEP